MLLIKTVSLLEILTSFSLKRYRAKKFHISFSLKRYRARRFTRVSPQNDTKRGSLALFLLKRVPNEEIYRYFSSKQYETRRFHTVFSLKRTRLRRFYYHILPAQYQNSFDYFETLAFNTFSINPFIALPSIQRATMMRSFSVSTYTILLPAPICAKAVAGALAYNFLSVFR